MGSGAMISGGKKVSLFAKYGAAGVRDGFLRRSGCGEGGSDNVRPGGATRDTQSPVALSSAAAAAAAIGSTPLFDGGEESSREEDVFTEGDGDGEDDDDSRRTGSGAGGAGPPMPFAATFLFGPVQAAKQGDAPWHGATKEGAMSDALLRALERRMSVSTSSAEPDAHDRGEPPRGGPNTSLSSLEDDPDQPTRAALTERREESGSPQAEVREQVWGLEIKV
jgi:hypothetical protein